MKANSRADGTLMGIGFLAHHSSGGGLIGGRMGADAHSLINKRQYGE
jgi:hypothetical protein